MRTRSDAAYHSAYVVTASSEEGVPVGKVLVDTGRQLHRVWEWMNTTSGSFTSATGERVARLCRSCRIDHKVIGLLDHSGECGSDEVKAEARAAIDAALVSLGSR